MYPAFKVISSFGRHTQRLIYPLPFSSAESSTTTYLCRPDLSSFPSSAATVICNAISQGTASHASHEAACPYLHVDLCHNGARQAASGNGLVHLVNTLV